MKVRKVSRKIYNRVEKMLVNAKNAQVSRFIRKFDKQTYVDVAFLKLRPNAGNFIISAMIEDKKCTLEDVQKTFQKNALIAWNSKTKRFYKKGVGKNTVITTTNLLEAFVFQEKYFLKDFLKDHPKFEQYAAA